MSNTESLSSEDMINFLGIVEQSGGQSVPYNRIAVEWWSRARMGQQGYRACYNQIGRAIAAAVMGGYIEEPQGFGQGALFTLKTRLAFDLGR